MKDPIVDCLDDMVRRRNRELAVDAALKAALGSGFSVVTFGMLYWMGWFIGFKNDATRLG